MNRTRTLINGSFVIGILGLVLSVLALNEYSMLYVANQLGVDPKSSFCNINAQFNCKAVNESSWSQWFGIPVAAWGAWFYSIVLGFSILFSDRDRFYDEEIFEVSSFFSLVGIIASLGLFYISKFEIGVLCPVCLGVYATNALNLGLVYWCRPKGKGYLGGVRDGFFTLLGFIFEGISTKARARGPVLRLLAIFILTAGVGVYSLRDTLSIRFLATFTAEPEWSKEPVKDIRLDTSPSPTQDYSQGPLDAPLKLVEFADYECPACQALSLVLSELLKKYEGRVHYTFKNYPLDMACNPALTNPIHEHACYAAYLSRCAGAQGKFWEMNEYLFDTGIKSSELEGDALKKKMEAGIKELNLDEKVTETCLASEETKNKISSDIQEGDALGLTGTPTIFINGRIVRDISSESLNSIFEQVLGSE